MLYIYISSVSPQQGVLVTGEGNTGTTALLACGAAGQEAAATKVTAWLRTMTAEMGPELSELEVTLEAKEDQRRETHSG